MPEAQIPRAEPADLADEDSGDLLLWADHHDALKLLRAMKTQWQVATPASGGLLYLGLNYAVLPVAERGTGVVLTPSVFEQLQVMEQEAETVLND